MNNTTWNTQAVALLNVINNVKQGNENKKTMAKEFSFTCLQVALGADKVAISAMDHAVSKEGGMQALRQYVSTAKTLAFSIQTNGFIQVTNSEQNRSYTAEDIIDSLVPLFSVSNEYKVMLAKVKETLPASGPAFDDSKALALYAKEADLDLSMVKKTYTAEMLKQAIEQGHASHKTAETEKARASIDNLEETIIANMETIAALDFDLAQDILSRLNAAFASASKIAA